MSVANLITQNIVLPSGRVVARTLYQPSLDASEPAEQLLVSARYRDVPLLTPNAETATNSALTVTNNILLPASGARQLLITRAILRGISYRQVAGTDPALLIGNAAFDSIAAIAGPGTALNLRVGGNVAIAFSQMPAGSAGTSTVTNLITGAVGEMSMWVPGAQTVVKDAAVATTPAVTSLVFGLSSNILLDADADVAGQGAVTLTIVPAQDAATDEKRANFTVDVFGFLLPPI